MEIVKLKTAVSKLFVYAAIASVLTGIFMGFFFSDAAVDIHLHDTYFIVAYFHVFLVAALLHLVLAGVYYSFPLLFKRSMNLSVGYFHFIVTFFTVFTILIPNSSDGIAGAPLRYYDYNAKQSLLRFFDANQVVFSLAIIVVFAQILFVFNFLFSIFFGKKV